MAWQSPGAGLRLLFGNAGWAGCGINPGRHLAARFCSAIPESMLAALCPGLPEARGIDALADGVLAGDRLALSHAITLAESSRRDQQAQASLLLHRLTQQAGTAADTFRIGVSGPPGAGKSSLIETLGLALLHGGHRVAVLAIDPSSERSGGAILGDKTRMPKLSAAHDAFVRPTPTRGTLGGVARATSDAIIACAAAGYSRVLVETVGVGQSETAVTDLVDLVMLVMPPVGGDELQVIKRGITEVADLIVVNKADGATRAAASRAAAAFRGAIHLHKRRRRSWAPAVLAASAHTGEGVDKVLEAVEAYRAALAGSGELLELRRAQRRKLAWTATEEAVLGDLRLDARVRGLFEQLLPEVESGVLAPRGAAERLVACFRQQSPV